MDGLFRLLSLFFLLVTVALTIYALATFRRERRISVFSVCVSLAIGVLILVLYLALSGARLKGDLGLPIAIVGLLLGFLWGATGRLLWKDGRAMWKPSLVALAAWCASLALNQAILLMNSALLASLGLAVLYLTTWGQVGTNANLLIRLLIGRARSGPVKRSDTALERGG